MKNKSDKKAKADALRAELSRVSTVILTTFKGITVTQDTNSAAPCRPPAGTTKW
jgi:hypothetical protein